MSKLVTPKTLALFPHLYSRTLVINAFRLLWVVLIFAGEMGSFFLSLSSCRWPKVETGQKARPKVSSTHVLLVGDTQVQHPGLLSAGSRWTSAFRRLMFELNLAKSWYAASRLQPDVVIFLGDMLGNGKSAHTLSQFEQAVQKFNSIFPIKSIPVYYVPGNNDVGLGSVPSVANNLGSFFAASFGPLNQHVVISNHSFVILNAPGLVDEDYQRHRKSLTFEEWKPIENGPIAFVKDKDNYDPGNVILLTHIPLARPESADCGPLREKGGIRRNAGIGYQSMLGKQTTSFLLKSLRPLVVFSADNQDYCDYTHVQAGTQVNGPNPTNAVREITIKSFSMSVHIKRPGFQLLSLVDPASVNNPDYPSFADAPCLLPDQDRIYFGFYFPFVCITLLILFAINMRQKYAKHSRKPQGLSLISSSPSSGRNSPNPPAFSDPSMYSATWSPYSPARTSPHYPTLPPYLRTPFTATRQTTHLVASLPGTPGPSSPLPVAFSDSRHVEEEDDTMYPTQYALRERDEDEWSHVGHTCGKDEEEFEVVSDHNSDNQEKVFSATQHPKFTSPRKRFWSYNPTFLGRQRRISLGLSSWKSLQNLLDFFGISNERNGGLTRGRGGKLSDFIANVFSVFWPASVAWFVINWIIV